MCQQQQELPQSSAGIHGSPCHYAMHVSLQPPAAAYVYVDYRPSMTQQCSILTACWGHLVAMPTLQMPASMRSPLLSSLAYNPVDRPY